MQVPLLHLRDAFRDLRFLLVLLLGNFVLVPLVACGMVLLLPSDPALRLGVLLVLLVPCTDWFITCTQLGRGDTASAIAGAALATCRNATLFFRPGEVARCIAHELRARRDLDIVRNHGDFERLAIGVGQVPGGVEDKDRNVESVGATRRGFPVWPKD